MLKQYCRYSRGSRNDDLQHKITLCVYTVGLHTTDEELAECISVASR